MPVAPIATNAYNNLSPLFCPLLFCNNIFVMHGALPVVAECYLVNLYGAQPGGGKLRPNIGCTDMKINTVNQLKCVPQ